MTTVNSGGFFINVNVKNYKQDDEQKKLCMFIFPIYSK